MYLCSLDVKKFSPRLAILFGGETPYSAGHVGTIDPECDVSDKETGWLDSPVEKSS